MMRPRLYVVDEPLANLDPATAARLLAMLRRLADEGGAVVIVEHRVEEALELRPDRVLYLEEGATRYLGAVAGFLEVADPGRSSCRSRSSWSPSRSAAASRGDAHRTARRALAEAAATRRRATRPAPKPPIEASARARRASSTATSVPAMATARSSTA